MKTKNQSTTLEKLSKNVEEEGKKYRYKIFPCSLNPVSDKWRDNRRTTTQNSKNKSNGIALFCP